MTLGLADGQGDLLDEVGWFCGRTLPENSIYHAPNHPIPAVPAHRITRRPVLGGLLNEYEPAA